MIKPSLYLSGPITGLADLNKPAFAAAAVQLRGMGFAVIDPHEIGEPAEHLLPWADYLKADIIAMLTGAEALALLPGWENSRGARLEVHIAEALGWEVELLSHWLDHP